ncbi:MAG: thioesterase, partial [Alphaproteobacteria bacterium]
AGDLVVVRSGIVRITEKSLHFVQEMRNGETGELVAVETAVAVHLDRTARRAVPFPAVIATRVRERLVSYQMP